ncbi:hypothetical protein [Delftia acidovorans]|uniref:hypothetical protein n=1 Tax=Delftia acidovorans TaxID=80866 RepID=UPI001E601B42|nr:hypothetical protein [Delftia acidovorans]
MQMRWVRLMAIAIGENIFLSDFLEKMGNIMRVLDRLPGSVFLRKWRAARYLFSLLLLSCAGISSTALAATIVFTVTDNSDAPNANATTPTTCVSTLGVPLLAHVRCERPFRQPTTRCKRWIRVPMFPSSLHRH